MLVRLSLPVPGAEGRLHPLKGVEPNHSNMALEVFPWGFLSSVQSKPMSSSHTRENSHTTPFQRSLFVRHSITGPKTQKPPQMGTAHQVYTTSTPHSHSHSLPQHQAASPTATTAPSAPLLFLGSFSGGTQTGALPSWYRCGMATHQSPQLFTHVPQGAACPQGFSPCFLSCATSHRATQPPMASGCCGTAGNCSGGHCRPPARSTCSEVTTCRHLLPFPAHSELCRGSGLYPLQGPNLGHHLCSASGLELCLGHTHLTLTGYTGCCW